MLFATLAHQDPAAGGPDPFLLAGGVLLGALGLVWFARSSARSVLAAVLAGLGCTLAAVAVLGHRHGAVAPPPALAVTDLSCSAAPSGEADRAAVLDPPPAGFVTTLNQDVPAVRSLTGCRAHEVALEGGATATVAVGRPNPGALDQGIDLAPPGSTAVPAAGADARLVEPATVGDVWQVQWRVGDLVVLAEVEARDGGQADSDGEGHLDEVAATLVRGLRVEDGGDALVVAVEPGSGLELGDEVPATTWAVNGAPRHLVRYAQDVDGDGTVSPGSLDGAPAVSLETVHLGGDDDLLDRAVLAARRASGSTEAVTVGTDEGSLLRSDAGAAVVAGAGAGELVVVRGSSVVDDVLVDAAAGLSLVPASELGEVAPVADLAGPISRDDDGSYQQAPSTPVLLPTLFLAAPVVLLAVGLGWWWRRRAR